MRRDLTKKVFKDMRESSITPSERGETIVSPNELNDKNIESINCSDDAVRDPNVVKDSDDDSNKGPA